MHNKNQIKAATVLPVPIFTNKKSAKFHHYLSPQKIINIFWSSGPNGIIIIDTITWTYTCYTKINNFIHYIYAFSGVIYVQFLSHVYRIWNFLQFSRKKNIRRKMGAVFFYTYFKFFPENDVAIIHAMWFFRNPRKYPFLLLVLFFSLETSILGSMENLCFFSAIFFVLFRFATFLVGIMLQYQLD